MACVIPSEEQLLEVSTVVTSWPTKVLLQPARWDSYMMCAATVRERSTTGDKGLARETHLSGGWLLMQAFQLITAAAFQQAVTILALHVGA